MRMGLLVLDVFVLSLVLLLCFCVRGRLGGKATKVGGGGGSLADDRVFCVTETNTLRSRRWLCVPRGKF